MRYPIVSAIVGAVAVLAALQLYSLILSADRGEITIPSEAELGGISVSLRAVQGLILQAASVPGVLQAEVDVRSHGEALGVQLQLVLDGGRPVPEVTSMAQAETERVLREGVGVAIEEINVHVKRVEEAPS